ncbi:glycoside hydrolase family 72 protein [Hypoxylon sp. EC38]|nr:glycoside hydrolase family 72 protein [Hypoxylon sp. EC38]
MAPSVTPVTIKGRYFWKGDTRFLINGVVYQPHGPGVDDFGSSQDPLSDDKLHYLEKSIPLFKELQINTLVVFNVFEGNNHDASMNLLAEAGIYVLQCIDRFQNSVGSKSGMTIEERKTHMMQCYFRAVDTMARYSNALGLVVSYEFIKDINRTSHASIIRSIVRDVKRYMRLAAAKRSQRTLPIGIVATDSMTILKKQFDYFASGPDREAVDFFAFNNFSWVGRSSMEASGYKNLTDIFSSAPIPVFFSMYGNNMSGARVFEETIAIYTNPDMLRVFSGGSVYEFFQRMTDNSGLVKAAGGTEMHDMHISRLKDFKYLRDSIRRSSGPLSAAIAKYSKASTPSEGRPDPPKPDWNWHAVKPIPKSPVNWKEVENQIADGEWVDVAKEMMDLAVDDLASSIWDRLNVDDIGP